MSLIHWQQGAQGEFPASQEYPLPTASRGQVSKKNSNNRAGNLLGAGATWEGEWEISYFPQLALNVISDQPGTLTLEFGLLKEGVDPTGTITDSDVDITLSSPAQTFANLGYFRTLANVPGRYFKVSFQNTGASTQTQFNLLTSVGDSLFPVSASPDNEVQVTVTERERGVWSGLGITGVAAETYRLLIDLDDTTNWPHDRDGRIDLAAAYIEVDRDASATGAVRIGVITRIDGTSADIEYPLNVVFTRSDTRQIVRDRLFSPNQLKCGVTGGVATGFVTSESDSSNTSITTASPIEDYRGTATQTLAVGDVIVKCERTAGTYDATISTFYHGERT